MVRRQIQLTEEQYKQIKRWASSLGISFAEAIRRCVAERLSAEASVSNRTALIQNALKVLGAYDDPEGPANIAVDHDRSIAEAFRR
jgi:hypothetical protein